MAAGRRVSAGETGGLDWSAALARAVLPPLTPVRFMSSCGDTRRNLHENAVSCPEARQRVYGRPFRSLNAFTAMSYIQGGPCLLGRSTPTPTLQVGGPHRAVGNYGKRWKARS